MLLYQCSRFDAPTANASTSTHASTTATGHDASTACLWRCTAMGCSLSESLWSDGNCNACTCRSRYVAHVCSYVTVTYSGCGGGCPVCMLLICYQVQMDGTADVVAVQLNILVGNDTHSFIQSLINQSSVFTHCHAPFGLRGCKNGPAPFPGRCRTRRINQVCQSVCCFIVLLFIRAPFNVLLVFVAMCSVFWLFWLGYLWYL